MSVRKHGEVPVGYNYRGANPIKCHEEVLSLQPMIPPSTSHFPPKRFDIFFLLTEGCSEEGLHAFYCSGNIYSITGS